MRSVIRIVIVIRFDDVTIHRVYVSTFLMKHKRPLVVATFAMTVDGKVTTKNLSPVDFTSREDKLHLFRQRALADAVLIGHTSLKRDNVRLGAAS